MADDTYTLDVLVTGSSTVTVTDDGSGIDTIRVDGVYSEPVSFTLTYSTNAGLPNSASAIYYTPFNAGFIGHTLVVIGVVENAIGSNGRDFIQGNVLANLIFGDNLASGAGMNDTLWGGSGNDTIAGGTGDDEILGDNDDDLLTGGAGVDTISGGGGIDSIEGGAGADVLSGGGSAGDTLSYAGSVAGVQVALLFGDATFGIGGDAQGDRITGFANVTGSAGDDRIQDMNKGTIAFGQNDNLFRGGIGRDMLILGGGSDTAYGGNGNDTLLADVGDDALYGGNNNDSLSGRRGQDTLSGGAGRDSFVFKTVDDSTLALAQRDTITDFSTAEGDRIILQGIDAEAGVPGNQAFHLVATFSGAVGELRLKVSGNDLLVQGDTNGNGTADFAILVLNTTTLTAADFVL